MCTAENNMENPISSEVGLLELWRVGLALSGEKNIHTLLSMIATMAR